MGCGGEAQRQPQPLGVARQALTCPVGCGGALGSAPLPKPGGTTTLTAWSNSPQLGTTNDCDPTGCAGASPNTAQNGQPSYGCPWQCVELTNRYFQGTWGGHKIQANAGAGYCQYAASSSFPEYYVYGSYGASTAGHAPIAGDVLVWAGHVAIATNSVAPGAAGTINILEENATCTGKDAVSWSGSMFGAKYGLGAICWVHVVANSAAGATCPSGSNWNGAGDYCWDQAGMGSTVANTLYSCAAAGGPAAALKVCATSCQHMPAGQNDQCLVATGPTCPTGGSWNGAGDYCWDQAGMGSTAANTLYSCAAAGGAATAPRVCSAGCQHMPVGQNDQCYALQANGTACTRGPQCTSGICADDVCCGSACGGCGSCATGNCTPENAGSTGNPACDPYVCSGAATTCPTACGGDADCAALDYCDAGACVATQANGGSCAAADQCQSTHCVGGICCESSCGPCGNCGGGTCTPLDAGSAGSPPCGDALVCTGSSVSCPSSCGTPSDCAPGYTCAGSMCAAVAGDAGSGDGGRTTGSDGGIGINKAGGCGCGTSSDAGAWLALLGLLARAGASRLRRLHSTTEPPDLTTTPSNPAAPSPISSQPFPGTCIATP